MAVEAVVEDINSVPEVKREDYVEKDGKWFLDVVEKDGYTLDNVGVLKDTLAKERSSAKSYEKEIKKFKKDFEGLEPADLLKAQADLQNLQEEHNKLLAINPEEKADQLADAKSQKKIAEKQKEWQKQYDNEVGSRDKKLAAATSQLQELMINNQAVEALAKAGADKNIDLLLPHVLKQSRLSENEDGSYKVEVVGPDGTPRVRSDGQNMELTDLMPEMKETWPNAFSVPVKKGAGVKPSGPNNTDGNKTVTALDNINEALKAQFNI